MEAVFSESSRTPCWQGAEDTRRSTSAAIEMLGSHPVDACSVTQHTVALSSGEAELAAINRGVAGAIQTREIADGFGVQLAIVAKSDSSAGRAMTQRRGAGRVRHLEARELWLQEKVRRGEVQVKAVPTEENPSDLGTKYLPLERIQKLLKLSGMRPAKGWTLAAAAAIAAIPGAEAANDTIVVLEPSSATACILALLAIGFAMVIMRGSRSEPAPQERVRITHEVSTQTEDIALTNDARAAGADTLSAAVFNHKAWYDLLDLATAESLRDECSRRGLPRSGIKVDLRKRLVENPGARPTERQARYLLAVLKRKIAEPVPIDRIRDCPSASDYLTILQAQGLA